MPSNPEQSVHVQWYATRSQNRSVAVVPRFPYQFTSHLDAALNKTHCHLGHNQSARKRSNRLKGYDGIVRRVDLHMRLIKKPSPEETMGLRMARIRIELIYSSAWTVPIWIETSKRMRDQRETEMVASLRRQLIEHSPNLGGNTHTRNGEESARPPGL